MNPARSMGMFIRTWRAEWAGLSRAQVAIAVNAHRTKGRRVSEATVRRWEEGQPPKSTAELEALCGVMGKRGLFPLELQQFRQAVLAGCAGRQFPELFGDDEWAYSERLPEIVRGICDREQRAAGSVSIVDLLALIADLTAALSGGSANRGSRAQTEAQQAALLNLQWSLHCILDYRNRRTQAVAICARASAFIDAYLDGCAPRHCGLGAADWEVQRLTLLGRSTRSSGPFRRLEMVRQEAEEGGDEDVALRALRGLATSAGVHGTPEQMQFVWAQRPEALSRALDTFSPEVALSYHAVFASLAIRMGFLDEAEHHLGHIQQWRDQGGMWSKCLSTHLGRLAEAKGRYAEAIRHYEACLAVQKRWSYGAQGATAGAIERCERSLRQANRRRKRKG